MATDQVQAVRKQREKADKIWQERYGKKAEPEPPKPAEPPVKAEPPAEPPAPPPEPSKPPEPEPQKAEEPQPPPIQEPPPKPEIDYKAMYEKALEESGSLKKALDTEKQRFQTLQGKYNAEIPRMNLQINALTEEMAKIKEHPVASEPVQENPATKSLKTDYPELYEGISAKVREEYKSLVDPLLQRIKTLEEGNIRTSQSSYERDLTRIVPNWREVNNEPDFVAWLGTYEPNGRTRYEMAMDALNRKDVDGTAYYFKAYLESKKPPESPAPPTQPIPPIEQPKKEKPLSVPRGGGANPPPAPPEETYTRADLIAHTREKIDGKWKGREDEWKKKEIKITKFLIKQSRKG